MVKGAGVILGAGRGPASVWGPPHGTRAALQAGSASLGTSLGWPQPVGTAPGSGAHREHWDREPGAAPVSPHAVQSRDCPWQHFTCSVPQFPHLCSEIMAAENAFFLPFYWLKGINILGFFLPLGFPKGRIDVLEKGIPSPSSSLVVTLYLFHDQKGIK